MRQTPTCVDWSFAGSCLSRLLEFEAARLAGDPARLVGKLARLVGELFATMKVGRLPR